LPLLKFQPSYFTGEVTFHVAQIVNRNQLQHHIPRNMVCFRYIIVNTLHKVDNKDDDDDDDDTDTTTITITTTTTTTTTNNNNNNKVMCQRATNNY